MLGAILVSGFVSYLAVAVCTRILGPDGYGVLASLLAASTIFVVLLRPLHTMATEIAVGVRNEDPVVVAYVGGGALTACIGICFGIAVVLAASAWALQIDPVPPAAVVSYLVASLYFAVESGLALGLGKTAAYALAIGVDPVARLLLVVPLAAYFGATGAIVAYSAGVVVGSAVVTLGSHGVRLGWSRSLNICPTRVIAISSGTTMLSVGASVLQYGDLLLLRLYASPAELGWYGAAASLGIALSAVASAFCVPVYARAAARARTGKAAWDVLVSAWIPIVAGGAIAIGLSLLWGDRIAGLFFGTAFTPAGALLAPYLAKTLGVVTVVLIGTYAVAFNRGTSVTIATVGASLSLLLGLLLKPSLFWMSVMVTVVTASICCGMALDLIRKRRASLDDRRLYQHL